MRLSHSIIEAMLKSYESIFKEYLELKKLKFTRERELILKEILNSKNHFEAEDLLFKFRKNDERISRATVFRTLNLLVDSELLSKVRIGDQRTFYEISHEDEHHDHLICLKCKKMIEFHDEVLEDRQDKICKNKQFKLLKHTHMLFGYCKDCQ